MKGSDFWKDKKVLITGHTGFKGAWLTHMLNRRGADICGVSLDFHSGRSFYETSGLEAKIKSSLFDICNFDQINYCVADFRPEVVFHLAAQSLVLPGFSDPRSTFMTNFTGTLNVLESIRNTKSCGAAIIITTDKVYENSNGKYRFTESDRLGGDDPYSASKSSCELLANSYYKSFFKSDGISLATVRAGNVIGGGDYNCYRLLPDIFRSWKEGTTLEIRNPNSTRPWQHVIEPLKGYISLAEKIADGQGSLGSFNFGPSNNESLSVKSIVEIASALLPKFTYKISSEARHSKEAPFLHLDSSKSERELGHETRWEITESIERTLSWYRECERGTMPSKLCDKDLTDYGYF